MPDNEQQQLPPDQLGNIRLGAEKATAETEAKEAVQRIREIAGLPDDADQEILEHYERVIRREAADNKGRSETLDRWNNRTKDPIAWTAAERELAADMIQKKARYQEQPKCPPGHPAHRHLTPQDMVRMSERDHRNHFDDERAWSQMSARERADLEKKFAARGGR